MTSIAPSASTSRRSPESIHSPQNDLHRDRPRPFSLPDGCSILFVAAALPGSEDQWRTSAFFTTRPTKNRAAIALRLAAQALHRSQSYLGDYFRRMRSRMGTPKVPILPYLHQEDAMLSNWNCSLSSSTLAHRGFLLLEGHREPDLAIHKTQGRSSRQSVPQPLLEFLHLNVRNPAEK
jgi:hypothetical protein